MIQRIQSLYLLLVIIVLSMMFFFPWMIFETEQGGFTFVFSGLKKGLEGGELIINAIPISVLLGLVIVLNLFCVLSYKKRPLQLRLTVFNMILLVGVYIMIIIYRYLSFDIEINATHYSFPLLLPVIALILTFMANRAIKKDEDLVRSVDRIR